MSKDCLYCDEQLEDEVFTCTTTGQRMPSLKRRNPDSVKYSVK